MNKIKYWQDRWLNQQTGWHQADVSNYLIESFSSFDLPPKSTIFVPLCGKSLDMRWFIEQGYQVIGVEASKLAIQEFFKEAALSVEVVEIEGLICWQAENIKIYQADYFDLTAAHLKTIDLIYDRASLVALPHTEQRGRADYAQHLVDIIPASIKMLLVTLDYNQQKMEGPPFAVSDAEIQDLYQATFNIKLLKEAELIEKEPRFQQKGLDSFIQRYYQLTKKG